MLCSLPWIAAALSSVGVVVLLGIAWYSLRMQKKLKVLNNELAGEIELLEAQKNLLADTGLKLLEVKEALELERIKTDRLLHNMLPERVIGELQENGTVKPERFNNVSVLFADIVNFTGIASTMEPADLIVELSDIFSEFDLIFKRHNCERLKTVGDAYMATAGLPDGTPTHWRNILSAAIEARDYLAERNSKSGKYKWLMRFGVNCGSVVGGIVGREKYIYDIFGDTVNTASRIEHSSEAMKINVSHPVYTLAANEFEFTCRGMVDVRGKGAMMMYFLEGRKSV